MTNPEHRLVHVIQGEFAVADRPEVVFSTILGSCVAACIRDPIAKVGGMNHFLLPGEPGGSASREYERYGVHLMELLINGLMQLGARRDRLEAKLFGGARVVHGLSDIGRKNGEFAEAYLKYEDVRTLPGDLGGTRGRRLHFAPLSGRARVSYLDQGPMPVERARPVPADRACGEIELFGAAR
jgi:chemotaxis protein CheD